MKKIKVTLNNEILELLKSDSIFFYKNMNLLSNSIVYHYLNRKVKRKKEVVKKEKDLQFFLHNDLKDSYFKAITKGKYKKEVDFLRDIFLEYIKLPINERDKIIKEYDKR